MSNGFRTVMSAIIEAESIFDTIIKYPGFQWDQVMDSAACSGVHLVNNEVKLRKDGNLILNFGYGVPFPTPEIEQQNARRAGVMYKD